MNTITTPVLVAGAGPSGLATSLLLSRYGIPHVIVEKYEGTAHTPRAHIINQRTVEIMRDLGLEEKLLEVATPWELMRNNTWTTGLTGVELARLQTWGTSPDRHADYVKASPCPMANCGQHLLEPIMLEAVRERGVADVQLGCEVQSLAQDADGVTVRCVRRASGEQFDVRAQYVVGADGGRSVVAREIGLEYDGEEGLNHAATVHFRADLSAFTSHRPGCLYWNASPGTDYWVGAGTLICHRPWYEWALVFMYDPETVDLEDADAALARVRQIVGDPAVEIEILNFSTWTINHVVAKGYSVGRVFCMGDSVHRHPPANGLGLNISIADAYNLAWKLKLVLADSASQALLETYSVERQPVGRQVVDRALQSVLDMADIPAALGFEPGQSAEDGWKALEGLYAPGPEGERRRRELAAAVEKTNYQFNAHGVELGYRYREGARVSDGTEEPRPDRDPELYYQPTSWPGAHLPHAWLHDGRRQLSTYDLSAGGFALLTGIGGEAWDEAGRRATEATSVELPVFHIGTRDGLVDCYGDWRALRGVEESGCVLVRPDRHVAWRAQSADPALLEQLPAVLAQLLGTRTPAAAT
jgi:2,4-dichlorophenol 6-monooxygenase